MRATRLHRPRGFTLIELIMVMVITATLAVVALPKFSAVNGWQVRAFADDVQSQTQSARRMALAQRRPIVATITPTGVSFAYVAGGSIATMNCPATASPCIGESATRSVTFNASNSGGSSTSTGSALTLTFTQDGSTTRVLQIEPETGLIRVLS